MDQFQRIFCGVNMEFIFHMTVKFVGKRRPLGVVLCYIVATDGRPISVHFLAEYAHENIIIVPIECMVCTWSEIRTK